MAKIIKNTTLSNINLSTGDTILAESQIEIDPANYRLYATAVIDDSSFVALIDSGDLVINDGINDLNATYGKNHLKYPDYAFNQRFLSEPERNNGLLSKNTQEAIEEAKAAIEGKVSVLPTFLNNGLTKNKWLSLDGAMESSDDLPAITAYDARLASVTYINDKDDTDTDIEFYRNGVWVYTWEVRNKKSAWKTNGLSDITFTKGDRISCFAREAIGTGVSPSSVIVFVNIQTVNSVQGEGGQQYGD